MSVFIELEWWQQMWAVDVGRNRELWARVLKRKDTFAPPDALLNHMLAAGAELAVSVYLDLPWTGAVMTTMKRPDIAPDIEVKWTGRDNGHLLVRMNVPDDRRMIFVRGTLAKYEIVGEINAAHAKRDDWWDGTQKYPCYKVPPAALRPVLTTTGEDPLWATATES